MTLDTWGSKAVTEISLIYTNDTCAHTQTTARAAFGAEKGEAPVTLHKDIFILVNAVRWGYIKTAKKTGGQLSAISSDKLLLFVSWGWCSDSSLSVVTESKVNR